MGLKCIVGSMSTPHPKLFILSAGLSTVAVETADQELHPHPQGFTSSSPRWLSLPVSLPLSHYLFPDLFIYRLSRFYSQSLLSLLFPLPPFFSISVFLISPEHPLTFYLFLLLFSLPVFLYGDILSSANSVSLTKIIMYWLCRLFMFVSLKSAPMASWKTAIILVSHQFVQCAECVCAFILIHVCMHVCT